MAETKTGVDQKLVRAIGHPLRLRLLTIFNERVASPSDLAAELGEPIGNVSYHTRILARLGCVELVRTKQVRGAIEHYYRAVVRPATRTGPSSRRRFASRSRGRCSPRSPTT